MKNFLPFLVFEQPQAFGTPLPFAFYYRKSPFHSLLLLFSNHLPFRLHQGRAFLIDQFFSLTNTEVTIFYCSLILYWLLEMLFNEVSA
jgi:hypothetical protein